MSPPSTVLGEGHFLFVLVQHLDRQPEALQLLHQHLERLRHAGWKMSSPLTIAS